MTHTTLKDVLQTFDFPVLQRRLNAFGFTYDQIKKFESIYHRNWERRINEAHIVERYQTSNVVEAYKHAYNVTARYMRTVIDWEQRGINLSEVRS